MKAKIILDPQTYPVYPPYLTPGKFYQIKGQDQFDKNIYFIITDDGSTTSVDISELIFLDEIRNEKLEELLK
jgi:hypothetical protein